MLRIFMLIKRLNNLKNFSNLNLKINFFSQTKLSDLNFFFSD